MDGPVFGPGNEEYEKARRVWNADIDRRPAVIAGCTSTDDVVAAVLFAQSEGLEIAVRGGGHSVPGHCVGDAGVMIDLSRLNDVSVDPVAKLATAGGGALLADLDAATQAHGLAVPVGAVGHTGVGGLTLGGGMGWLSRQAGLSIDNLVSAEVVLADGRVLRASDEKNPDLFWALRGGGGNFGVVTEFEFRLHEVGPMVEFGFFFWEIDRGAEALRLIREVVADLPRSVNVIIASALTAPPAPFVPEEHHHRLGQALLLTGFGSAAEHKRVVARIRETLPPLFDHVTPMPYVALQQLFDEASAWGFHDYDKGIYLESLSDEVVEVLTEYASRKSSPLSFVFTYWLDEAFSEIGQDDTAFGGSRSPGFFAFLIAEGITPEALVADRAWVRSLWDALQPYSRGIPSYVNAISEAADEDRVLATYGQAKYARLARIKSKYDPDNVFHRNANIKPG
jgi:FAD/FMN-containing dehydrogenase